MTKPTPQEVYGNCQRMCQVRKGRTEVREKDWILHQPGLGDHQADPRRARGLRNPKARKTGPRYTMSIAGYLRNRLS